MTPFGAPIIDRLGRIFEQLAVTAWGAGMDDPTLLVMLDKEGVEWDQQFRQGERVPTAQDIDLDGGHLLALIRGMLRHFFLHPRLLYSLVSSVPSVPPFRYAVIAPSIASRDLIPDAAAHRRTRGVEVPAAGGFR